MYTDHKLLYFSIQVGFIMFFFMSDDEIFKMFFFYIKLKLQKKKNHQIL